MTADLVELSRVVPLRKQACTCCRQKKKRCDAGKPACRRCVKRKTMCTYQLVPPEVTLRVRLAKQSRKEVKAMSSTPRSTFSSSSSSSSSSNAESNADSSADEESRTPDEMNGFIPSVMLHPTSRSCLHPPTRYGTDSSVSTAPTASFPFTSLAMGYFNHTPLCEPPETDFYKMLAAFSFADSPGPESAFSPPWPEMAARHKSSRFPLDGLPQPSVLAQPKRFGDMSASPHLLLVTPLEDQDTDSSSSVSSPEMDGSDHSGLGIWSPADLYGLPAKPERSDADLYLIDAFLRQHGYLSSNGTDSASSTPSCGSYEFPIDGSTWMASAGIMIDATSS